MGCIDYSPYGVANNMHYECNDADIEVESVVKVDVSLGQQALFAVETLDLPDGTQYQATLFDIE